MKTKLEKNLTWLFFFILLLGSLAANVTVNQTFGYFGEPAEEAIAWSEGIKGLQMSIVFLRCLGVFTFFGSLLLFIVYSVHSIREGVLFPRKNIALLYVCVLASFIYFLCNDNLHIVTQAERSFRITFEALVVPSLILVFAFLYKAAVQINEENSLTI